MLPSPRQLPRPHNLRGVRRSSVHAVSDPANQSQPAAAPRPGTRPRSDGGSRLRHQPCPELQAQQTDFGLAPASPRRAAGSRPRHHPFRHSSQTPAGRQHHPHLHAATAAPPATAARARAPDTTSGPTHNNRLRAHRRAGSFPTRRCSPFSELFSLRCFAAGPAPERPVDPLLPRRAAQPARPLRPCTGQCPLPGRSAHRPVQIPPPATDPA